MNYISATKSFQLEITVSKSQYDSAIYDTIIDKMLHEYYNKNKPDHKDHKYDECPICNSFDDIVIHNYTTNTHSLCKYTITVNINQLILHLDIQEEKQMYDMIDLKIRVFLSFKTENTILLNGHPTKAHEFVTSWMNTLYLELKHTNQPNYADTLQELDYLPFIRSSYY